jgi:hypothetical protein
MAHRGSEWGQFRFSEWLAKLSSMDKHSGQLQQNAKASTSDDEPEKSQDR